MLMARPWVPQGAETYIQTLAQRFAQQSPPQNERELHAFVAENRSIHERDCFNLNPATNVSNPKAEALLAAGLGARPSLGYPGAKYEMGLEGFVLFIMLWWFARRPRPLGQVSALFLTGYGVLRFLVEYTREPDRFLGVLAGGMTMGQWLSLPMIALGVWLATRTRKP